MTTYQLTLPVKFTHYNTHLGKAILLDNLLAMALKSIIAFTNLVNGCEALQQTHLFLSLVALLSWDFPWLRKRNSISTLAWVVQPQCNFEATGNLLPVVHFSPTWRFDAVLLKTATTWYLLHLTSLHSLGQYPIVNQVFCFGGITKYGSDASPTNRMPASYVRIFDV